jgi:hypothetical protein
MAIQLPNPIWRFEDDAGAPLAGGKVYFYQAGTTTPKDTYTTASGAVTNANPVILNGRGEAVIWFGTGSYKMVLKDSNDVEIKTVDNIPTSALNVTGTVAIANGGTGQITAAAGFDALSPMSAPGDLIYGGASGTRTRLAPGTANQLLHSGSTPSWSAVDLAADVGSSVLPYANGGAGPTSTTEALFHSVAQKKERATYSSDTAITQKDGLVIITKGSAAALTLAAPTAGGTGVGDDGKEMWIFSTTAFAHVITQAAPGFNNGGAGSDVATMTAAVGNWMHLVAYNGVWYVLGSLNVTLS